MNAIARYLAPFERSDRLILTAALLAAFLLYIDMAPTRWSGNEIVYFDLALRLVSPDQFGPYHAIFDSSRARDLGFLTIGSAIKLFGIESALIFMRIVMAVLYASALAMLAKSLELSVAETMLAILAFFVARQSYFGGEWVFGGVEPKTLAYAAVIASLALVLRNRRTSAVILAVLATYFHFLVGGFWALAIVVLIALHTGSYLKAVQFLAIYTILVLPLVGLVAYEQFFLAAEGGANPGLSTNQIYSEIRAPHHVAPFKQLRGWLPGIGGALGVTALLAICVRWPPPPPVPSKSRATILLLARWLLILHAYLLFFALPVAYFDRHTYWFGPFYLFRPASLVLLLTLMLGVLWLRELIDAAESRRPIVALMFAVLLSVSVVRVSSARDDLLVVPQLPLEKSLKPQDRAVIDWVRNHTEPDAVVVLEPTYDTDWGFPWIAFERLIRRPTLVSYKSIPTLKHEMLRWYALVQWRLAVFQGACDRLEEYPVKYLVTVNPATLNVIKGCGTIVWTSDSRGVVKVHRRASPLSLVIDNSKNSRLQTMLKTPIDTGKISDDILTKSAVAIGSVGGTTWGDELAEFRQASTAFVQSLGPFSAFDRILSDGGFMRMPLRTRISIASSAALASSVSELAPKPISAMSFAQAQLPAYKAVGLLVVSEELAQSMAPGANDLFANELRKAVARATDKKFLEVVTEGTGVASAPSSGDTAAAFLADLSAALQSIETGAGSKLYLILPVSVWNAVSLLRDTGGMLVTNGAIGPIRVVVSSAATADGVLLDGSSIAADSDLVTTDVVRNATLRMDDDPTAGSFQIVSLWQNNLVAMRAERFFGAAVLRSDGVALITDMTVTA